MGQFSRMYADNDKEQNQLTVKDMIDNIIDCLNRAQKRIKELGDISFDLSEVTDDMILADDLEQSIDEISGLYEYINSALVFAVYAGEKDVQLHQEGKDDLFGFGPDSAEMRERYLDWAQEIGDNVWYQDGSYELLESFFDEKLFSLSSGLALSKLNLDTNILCDLYNSSDIDALLYLRRFCFGEQLEFVDDLICANNRFIEGEPDETSIKSEDEYHDRKWNLFRSFGVDKDDLGQMVPCSGKSSLENQIESANNRISKQNILTANVKEMEL